jgi:hypothetical protein
LKQLERWFDGGDVVTLLVALVSIGLSVWSLRRQSRIDSVNEGLQSEANTLQREQLKLQHQMAALEELRRSDEVVRGQSAEVRVAMWFRQEGPTYETSIQLENVGSASAHNVIVNDFKSLKTGKTVSLLKLPVEIGELPPRHPVTYQGFVTMEMGNEFSVSLSWEDMRGPQNQQLTVTRSRRP